ncbi:CDP-glycerol glycerophosphotransferase family protein [Neobacillus sp. OS1-33]|uniref:bifunctional glycosyltransferase/CDP-glycerol:glycerophosphate glycerophosphotransferase n=1 Tax=Neobacillus sp. OS1-33 TaxID=3070683 RepID=UPI0027E1490D|nr:CDP-glycerol glycerophosphotransferase family protein [Neobacillus sp. OS1-33]WML24854.1 CDP-glycerol glycerophosphotransferase family protein [Neobacillus sp. OS1-33]
MQKENHQFLFSVIMAIYNVEEYLEEAIDSVINQTLDFSHHIQIILVNDGSLDNSGDICESYALNYPQNIIYIKKDNNGASSARNAGLKLATGKYINFLDPDDTLSPKTLTSVYKFFEEKGNEIDVVSIPMEFFGLETGPHLLNNKFTKKRIINILDEPKNIQLSAPSSFIKQAATKDHFFNESMKYAEDTEWLTKIILEKKQYGVVPKGQYNYRRRSDTSSATQSGKRDSKWYNEYLKKFQLEMINYSLEKFGKVPKYIQYMLAYDIQWRINISDNEGILNNTEKSEFFDLLARILEYIDVEVILDQNNLNLQRKNFLLSLKTSNSEKNLYKTIFLKDDVLLQCGNNIINSLKKQKLTLELLYIENEVLYIEGNFGSLFDKSDLQVIAEVGSEIYYSKIIERKPYNIYVLGRLIKEYLGYRLEIPLSKVKNKEEIKLKIGFGNKLIKVDYKFGPLSRINNSKWSYFTSQNLGIYYKKSKKSFVVFKNDIKVQRILERFILKKLLRSKKVGARKAFIVRLIYRILLNLKGEKQVWLFLDRLNKADDNAEALFEYAMDQKDGIKKYFIINNQSEDFNRLKKIGPVVSYGSYKHKLLHLLSDNIISSHADEYVINPFQKMKKYYNDLFKFNYVFLQHGITKDDISGWLNKYKKNISLFITSAKQEYDSIINGSYNYEEKNVALTGFARFDKLENNDKRQIVIMPTWRNYLVHKIDPLTGERPYSDSFRESAYFENFNSLLGDENLVKAAEKYNYQIVFFPHPNIRQQLKDFNINPKIKITKLEESYRQYFNESSLLITDYSSVAFDFAYLKKPLLYFQFEKNHLEEGYFNYETMGFGEIIDNKDDLVNTIISYMESNCVMPINYVKRVESFYPFTDENNRKRIYDAIRQINQLNKTIK